MQYSRLRLSITNNNDNCTLIRHNVLSRPKRILVAAYMFLVLSVFPNEKTKIKKVPDTLWNPLHLVIKSHVLRFASR